MKREYHEGPEAAERFEKMAIKVFRAPKSNAKPVAKKQVVVKQRRPARASVYVYRALAAA
jgi:hypothetical protein